REENNTGENEIEGVRLHPFSRMKKRARRVSEGRGRGERAPTVRKPPWPSSTLKLASTAFLVCGPSPGFVVGPAAGFTHTSAFSSLT
ncbi:unnamed protein product, partial [Ectocarpus sp. 6 AP-2014]